MTLTLSTLYISVSVWKEEKDCFPMRKRGGEAREGSSVLRTLDWETFLLPWEREVEHFLFSLGSRKRERESQWENPKKKQDKESVLSWYLYDFVLWIILCKLVCKVWWLLGNVKLPYSFFFGSICRGTSSYSFFLHSFVSFFVKVAMRRQRWIADRSGFWKIKVDVAWWSIYRLFPHKANFARISGVAASTNFCHW